MFGKKKEPKIQEESAVLGVIDDGKRFGLSKVPTQFEIAITNRETKTEMSIADILVEIANRLDVLEEKMDEVIKLANK